MYCCRVPSSYILKPLIGNGQCAVLVQSLTGAPLTRYWRKGKTVRGLLTLSVGTAIATFDKTGKYPNKSFGNHAALYLKQDDTGIWVVEQYVGLEKIQRRHIRFMNGHKPYHNNVANDGDAYSVIQ